MVVVECKASEKPRKRSLQKDIEEFANLKGHIARAIKDHYGASFKPKIVWIFATQNIQWSSQDVARAKGENIQIITERELRYYLQIAEHLRAAARYQFLAEFLRDQKIPQLANYKVPAIKSRLGPYHFYGFITTAEELLKISFVNHRSLDDPEGAPTYQRLVSRTRMRQISSFLKDGGFFPTNLLINFNRPVRFERMSKDSTGDLAFGHLYLPDRYKSAWILAKAGDGDVVFADPPYTVNHNLNGFLKYNEQLFSWLDQERLHDASLAAIERGARVYISNADHSSIRKLYKEKVFQLHSVGRYSRLSGSNVGRKLITELVISSR